MLPIKLQLPDSFFEEETRCDYAVSPEMKKLWAILLDMLDQIMKICEKHNIRYYANGGTALGAARHQGFIPWDDDLDLMMLRADYNKFIEVAPKELEYPYFMQTEQTDPGCRRGHIQIRNSATTGILKSEYRYKLKFNQGVFLDIFPLDYAPDSPKEFEEFKKQIKTIRGKEYECVYLFRSMPWVKCRNIPRHICSHIKHFILSMWAKYNHVSEDCYLQYFNEFEEFVQKYNNTPTKHLINSPMITAGTKLLDAADFDGEPVLLPFEMFKIPVPHNYENTLKTWFGDWHKLVRGGSMHSGLIFDAEKPYSEYLK